MKNLNQINLDREWSFSPGTFELMRMFRGNPNAKTVNLPHDYMVASEVSETAVPGPSSGYYTAGVAHYVKKIEIPAEWADEKVFLYFEGVMMNATVEINGYKVSLQHYGYVPFPVDITPYAAFGKENRILVTVNPSMQPNSRWFSGAGIFRSVWLIHTPKVHVKHDGLFAYTEKIVCGKDGSPAYAQIKAEVDICNETPLNKIVGVTLTLIDDATGEEVLSRSQKIQVNPNAEETAHMAFHLENPKLWNAENPNLYCLKAEVTDIGEFRTHMTRNETTTTDTVCELFGVRTIIADVVNGLQINGETVKLAGGCLHHDNGLLGAVSLYDAEYRKLSLLKASGFNAVRTTHNPPSPAFVEACDRLGMYIFDEAFDAWGMAKQPGDYSMFFATDWQKDLTAFIRRDRIHPSVIIWSTGNEIVERGGLNNGYTLATQLADTVKALDPSRPVSNGICSFWNGLDDDLQIEGLQQMMGVVNGGGALQNADMAGQDDHSWEALTECFTNGLDIVGYNYMENKYENSHKLFPDRVILGSENYPKEIGARWPMVKSTPYVIGDFTWTAYDYIGEAGIGKAVFFEPDDPATKMGPFALSSHTSVFPWRTANDADYDINGNLLPQGAYRQVIFGSPATHVFSYDPANYGKTELISMWGFINVEKNWNWAGKKGQNTDVVVFSSADEVELLVNGVSKCTLKNGERLAGNGPELPNSFLFTVPYEAGTVTAISRKDGKEISRDELITVGAPAALRLCAEKQAAAADGHSLIYVQAEILDAAGHLVPDASVLLSASVTGSAELLGFGSGNPVTDENYTAGTFHTYRGHALAILRAGYEAGETVLTVNAEGLGEEAITVEFK